jgi:hypothetical protein
MSNRSVASRNLRLIVIAGLLAAISTGLRFLETPLPLLPGFLKLDFSNIPAMIGGFALGPIAGTAILFIKNLIYLPFSSTMGVGEIADFVISASLILPAGVPANQVAVRASAGGINGEGTPIDAVQSPPGTYTINANHVVPVVQDMLITAAFPPGVTEGDRYPPDQLVRVGI